MEADDFAYAAALRTLGRCEDWRSAAALFATLPTAGGAAFSAEAGGTSWLEQRTAGIVLDFSEGSFRDISLRACESQLQRDILELG